MTGQPEQLGPVSVSVHVDPPSGETMPGIYLCMSDPSGQALVLEVSPAMARNVADLLVCAAGMVEGGTPVTPSMRKAVQ